MKRLFLLSFMVVMIFKTYSQAPSKEQVAVKKVVVDFFKWYRNNGEKMNDFHLYKGKKKKDSPPYVIDWKEAEKYFTYIRKNVPWFGQAFIENERKYFKETQKEFDKYPEDEIPSGFDYDRFTGGQEDPKIVIDEYLMNKKTKLKILVNGNKAEIFFSTSSLAGEDNKTEVLQTSKMELVKENTLWKISKNIWPVE